MPNLKNVRVYVISELLEQVKAQFAKENKVNRIQMERNYTNDRIIDYVLRKYIGQ